MVWMFLTFASWPAYAEGQAAGGSGHKQESAEARFEIRVLTYGPGGHVFTKFGHNAIWVFDRETGEHRVYNFGTLDMEDSNIVADFLQGRLRYWVSVTDLEGALQPYRRDNRSVVAQLLDLSPLQAVQIDQLLQHNALPENRFYIYDYYQDNCSTRVRDIVDQVTSGSLRELSLGPASMTWRQHTLRLSQSDWAVSLGLNMALGPRVDEATTIWDEMFLPGVLQSTLRKASIEKRGKTHPLVKEERLLFPSSRPKEDRHVTRRWPLLLLIGAGCGSLQLFLGRLSLRLNRSRRAGYRFALVATWGLAALFGLILGSFGTLCTFFWIGTDHQIAYWNANILLFSPLMLAMPLLAGLAALGVRVTRIAYGTTLACLTSGVIGVVLLISSSSVQDTTEFVALNIPIVLGITLTLRVLHHLEREAPTHPV